MPKKKTAQQAGTAPSSQPSKKFKADTSGSENDEQKEQHSVGRRSLRNRSLDENIVGDPVTSARATRGSAKPTDQVTSSRPRRSLQNGDDKIATRGGGFVMKSPSPKQHISCPLEVSVQVTPCDLSARMDKATVTESSNRKRKGKPSPKTEEKKSKAAEANNYVVSPSKSMPLSSAVSKSSSSEHIELKQCSVKLDIDSACPTHVRRSVSNVKNSNEYIGQEGLPRELPDKSADPLFTRRVISLKCASHVKADSQNDLSVLTYNILAECHRLRKDSDYSYTAELHLDMEYRHYRIVDEIKHFNSDIVCLQEVEEIYYNDNLLNAMKMLGYEGIFCKRVGDNYPEGEATFYKSSQFVMSEQEEYSYTQLANQDIERLEQGDDIKSCIRKHINREAVLLVCKLTHRTTKKQVVIGNTHLTWTRFIDIDIPCVQTGYAFRVMDKASNHGEIPFVLCGDFNTRVSDPGYQLATDGYLTDENIKILQDLKNITLPDGSLGSLINMLWCAFQHPARHTSSSYLSVQGCEPDVTSKNFLMNHGVDYMWSSNLQATSIAQVNKIAHSMPNIIYPSDHVSLQASYNI